MNKAEVSVKTNFRFVIESDLFIFKRMRGG